MSPQYTTVATAFLKTLTFWNQIEEAPFPHM